MARILIEAIQSGQEMLAREIILKCGSCGGIDSQTSRRDGTALFFCSSRGYLELAKLLLDRGASVVSTDKNRATPLHGAVDNGHLEVVKLLIRHDANLNAQTYRGDTPLHLAAYRGFCEISQCLVEAGADSTLLNSNSFTAENEARGRGHQDLSNYLKSAQNACHLAERTDEGFDSMIQLDPPSLASSVNYQTNESHNQTNHVQLDSSSALVRRRNPDCRPDATFRSKSCDCGNESQYDMSVCELNPPFMNLQNGCSSSLRKRLSQRHSSETTDPRVSIPTTDFANIASLSPTNENLISPILPHLAFPNSNVGWLSPTSTSNKSVFISPQLLHPAGSSYSADIHRRPSTGSAGSCFSDFSGGTGSDAGSLPSIGSDGSGYFSDGRREDIELHDHQLGMSCQYDQQHEEDLVLMSLGVRNPPAQKHKRQLSTASVESSDFSPMYDSTLFSLTSMVSGSRSSPDRRNSSASTDFTALGKSCARLNSLELNNDFRPRLDRATSINCSFPSPNLTVRPRPHYNKSVSADHRPSAAPSECCPRFDRIPSNDLSSTTFSMSDKPSCSMTCVNIPLN